MTTSGRPSWLDRAVHEALTVCPTAVPWEMRLALIAAAPTIQAAATEALRADLAGEIEAEKVRAGVLNSDWGQGYHKGMDAAVAIVRGEPS